MKEILWLVNQAALDLNSPNQQMLPQMISQKLHSINKLAQRYHNEAGVDQYTNNSTNQSQIS